MHEQPRKLFMQTLFTGWVVFGVRVFLWKWGCTKYRRIPGRKGRVPKSVPSPEKLIKTRDLELPFSEGSLPSCLPHSVGYTRTSLHPYFPVAKKNFPIKGRPHGTGRGVKTSHMPRDKLPLYRGFVCLRKVQMYGPIRWDLSLVILGTP